MKKKIDTLYEMLAEINDEREFYEQIILFGKKSEPFDQKDLVNQNLVEGCQSRLYLSHTFKDGKIKFNVYSESLFSFGLASILAYYYSDESPKATFTHPPDFLNNLTIFKKISINRQVGISNLFRKMQLICSKYI
jgi:cysteine desulfuration protein SufE